MADLLPKDQKVLTVALVGGAGLALLVLLARRKGSADSNPAQNAVPFGPAWWGGALWHGTSIPGSPFRAVKPPTPKPPGGPDPFTPGGPGHPGYIDPEPPHQGDQPGALNDVTITGGKGGTIKGGTSLYTDVLRSIQTERTMGVL